MEKEVSPILYEIIMRTMPTWIDGWLIVGHFGRFPGRLIFEGSEN